MELRATLSKYKPAFELYNNANKPLLHFSLDKKTHACRVSCGEIKRVFFIEKTAQLKEEYILKNEYDQQLGSMSKEDETGTAGIIDIDNTFYSYKKNSTNTAISFYNDEDGKELLFCNFVPGEIDNYKNYITFCLCWYVFLNASNTEVTSIPHTKTNKA